MTQDEIIEMVMQISGCDRPEYDSPALKMFEAFAKLVAAKEREACAKIVQVHLDGNSDLTTKSSLASVLDYIRVRGEA